MKIEVYVKEKCPQCDATLRQLLKQGTAFTTKSAGDYLDFLAALGAQAAPVVIVYADGRLRDWWTGYRPDSIRALAEAGDAA